MVDFIPPMTNYTLGTPIHNVIRLNVGSLHNLLDFKAQALDNLNTVSSP